MTEMTEGRLNEPGVLAAVAASLPIKRIGESYEIADAILWLLSDEASFIAGAMLDASGGGYII